ncbi:SIR2 family protein [Paenibacillus barengoltzii]|uniref:SIR2 family protein n=1 Tax=Paenibacillus barengoltzii TaxID=343517 RepID=UPI0038790839
MTKPLFLFGNGLSIALSPEFALRNITTKFIEELDKSEKEFLTQLCQREGGISFDDFEANFVALESALESVIKYNSFINSEVGKMLLSSYNLPDPQLSRHIDIIERIYRKYIVRILRIIHGNVRLEAIERKLSGFTSFFIDSLNSGQKGFVFTLNYDLLVETILLEKIGTYHFTDFCFPSGNLRGTNIPKFDFNPRRSEELYTETQRKIELHHLHGSLSLFYDYYRNRVAKLKSEDIGYEEIYEKIYQENLPLIPAIITGGGKSDKIVQYPFDFYYRALKDICDFGQANKLFVIGYSFRDEHINDLISRWTSNVKDYTKGLLIVDYKQNQSDQEEFKKFVRSQIRKRPAIPDDCFEFGGVNNIHDVEGTEAKELTQLLRS